MFCEHRSQGVGPAFVRVEGRVLYPEPALLKYIAKNTVGSEPSDDPATESESLAGLQALLEELLAVLPSGGD